ncbi:Mn-dependent transcriptional regulator MntR [Microbacterium esteraromaticum]|uniref:Manganese transport regulator n=1 Tax=Microbacterium esteraromaticum TaxID=57043 RepID=A0A1R4JR41_9MICO|nr:Mn-dependent transcriptional regulator MntR [Microbacterium esteraromaticum]
MTASTVAERAGVKLSTASDAVRKLADQGLVDHAPYGSIALTEEGRRHAVAMVRRHRLIETFLVEVLGYRWDQVHDEAETLEHAVSDFMIDRIDQHLDHPERDPHGDPIPTRDGVVSRPDAILLTALAAGSRASVERISDDDSELLQFFADHRIRFGTVLEARAAAPYSETIEVAVDGLDATLPLGRAATDAVWVRALD